MSKLLAEADARIHPDGLATGGLRRRDAIGKLLRHLGDHVLEVDILHHGGGMAAQMAKHDGGARRGRYAQNPGIDPSPRNVVDDGRASLDRGLGCARLIRVDGNSCPAGEFFRQAYNDRHHALDLLRLGNRLGIGPRRLAAHVDPMRPLIGHGQAIGHRAFHRIEPSAIRK